MPLLWVVVVFTIFYIVWRSIVSDNRKNEEFKQRCEEKKRLYESMCNANKYDDKDKN